MIIPAFNAAATIGAAIESVRAQTHAVHEIVVGDDASTDDTASIAEGLGAKVLRLAKGNGSIARNRAAEAATGDRLFFLDADDLWEPTKVAEHLAVGADLILDRSQPFSESGEAFRWVGGLDGGGMKPWQALLSHRAWPSGSGFSVSREAYWRVSGFNEELTKFQDVDFWVRCAQASGGYWNLDRVLTRYRQNSVSVSRSTANHEKNLAAMLSGWPFATDLEKKAITQVAMLMMAERSRFPGSLNYLAKAGWPIGSRFFWKCLLVSINNARKPIA